MKKWTSLLAALIMVFVLATGVQAQEISSTSNKAITVWINGEQVEFNENEVIIEKGTTLVPARAMLETLGYSVTWDHPNQAVLAEKYGFSIADQSQLSVHP